MYWSARTPRGRLRACAARIWLPNHRCVRRLCGRFCSVRVGVSPRSEMHIDRSRAAEVGRDTVRILDEGGYRSPSGAWVDLRALLERAVRETQEYPPNCRVENNIDRGNPPTIAVEN